MQESEERLPQQRFQSERASFQNYQLIIDQPNMRSWASVLTRVESRICINFSRSSWHYSLYCQVLCFWNERYSQLGCIVMPGTVVASLPFVSSVNHTLLFHMILYLYVIVAESSFVYANIQFIIFRELGSFLCILITSTPIEMHNCNPSQIVFAGKEKIKECM